MKQCYMSAHKCSLVLIAESCICIVLCVHICCTHKLMLLLLQHETVPCNANCFAHTREIKALDWHCPSWISFFTLQCAVAHFKMCHKGTHLCVLGQQSRRGLLSAHHRPTKATK